MRNLCCATGIDDVDLGGDLVARTQPSLRDQCQRVVGVVVGEHLRGVQRQLLRGVPDPVVGAGLAEVITGGGTLGALRVDEFGERRAGRGRPRRRPKAPSNTTTPGPSVSARMSSACTARRWLRRARPPSRRGHPRAHRGHAGSRRDRCAAEGRRRTPRGGSRPPRSRRRPSAGEVCGTCGQVLLCSGPQSTPESHQKHLSMARVPTGPKDVVEIEFTSPATCEWVTAWASTSRSVQERP